MTQIYQFSVNNGESLPEFRADDYSSLMKYKEFVGDRMANDWIFKILSESLEQNPSEFVEQQNRILKREQGSEGLGIANIAVATAFIAHGVLSLFLYEPAKPPAAPKAPKPPESTGSDEGERVTMLMPTWASVKGGAVAGLVGTF